ncbi:MAG: hypothetical protein JRI61_07800 [Deltaproteobacteria bacterium]|nr:hypothetical protein [Deltaproteobacteria bacterium]
MNLKVECYSGYRGEETPRSIRFGSRKIEVKRILDRWLSPDHRYFKIIDEDNSLYIIRHDVISQNWELSFFKQADHDTDGKM